MPRWRQTPGKFTAESQHGASMTSESQTRGVPEPACLCAEQLNALKHGKADVCNAG